jgi:hypothetical protein
MTQELIANMLGVRREGVTAGARKLQKSGLIRYARGRITVLDRGGIEERTCECHEVVRKEYARLLCCLSNCPSDALSAWLGASAVRALPCMRRDRQDSNHMPRLRDVADRQWSVFRGDSESSPVPVEHLLPW